jgi:hypothetical protein
MNPDFVIGQIDANSKTFPLISTAWSRKDLWDTFKVRWSIGRMNYTVTPGIYAVGNPDHESRVFVTGNFKLSLDHLRRALDGLNAWILVLNTKGINVWCAAGKKTFGTDELVHRIGIHELNKIVTHRKIIVPQLGATGVAAHKVKEQTGFTVIYGPVRAEDIKTFLDSGLKASAEMRTVTFPLSERLKLIPVDLFYAKYYLLIIPSLLLILAGLNPKGFSVDSAVYNGGKTVVNVFSAYLAGCALTPALLPWIPFRRFSLKGLIIGLIIGIPLVLSGFFGTNIFEKISWFLMMGSISSFMAMNFTGSSTFTSLSGVQKEMKTALPLQIGAAGIGLMVWIITRFI